MFRMLPADRKKIKLLYIIETVESDELYPDGSYNGIGCQTKHAGCGSELVPIVVRQMLHYMLQQRHLQSRQRERLSDLHWG